MDAVLEGEGGAWEGVGLCPSATCRCPRAAPVPPGSPSTPGVQSTGSPGITHGRWDGPGSVDGFGSSSVGTREFGSLGAVEDVQFVLVCAEPNMTYFLVLTVDGEKK